MSHVLGFVIAGIVCLGVGALLLWIGRGQQSKRNLVARVVTSNAGDVARLLPGEPVEVKGVLRCDAPLAGEISQQPCVYYDSRVTREYERRERDNNGNWHTDRRSETVASNKQSTPFYVEDASGRVLVRPDGADLDAQKVVDRFEQAAAGGPTITLPMIGGVSLNLSGEGTVGYKYEEWALPVGSQVYVLGAAQESGEIARPPEGSKSGKFIISYRSEETLQREWGRNARWLAYSAIALAVIGGALIVAGLVSLVV
ncbi:MAG TPA: E3 ubiquitin ligase family protein [Thermomicrobiaceae bacterium]|nr:E3 ubiquitin ligase family protein [Thermomicrobiaceae bacterium]